MDLELEEEQTGVGRPVENLQFSSSQSNNQNDVGLKKKRPCP